MKLNNITLTLEHLQTINNRIEELTAKHVDKPEIKIISMTVEPSMHGGEDLEINTNRGQFYAMFDELNNNDFYVGSCGMY